MSELTTLLAAEEAVVAAARARTLPPELRLLSAQAGTRVAALRAELARANQAPPRTRGGRVGLESALERAIAAAYAAVQTLDDERTLRVVARVMAGDGQSLALLRMAMNRSPSPDALETGKAP